MSRFVSLEVKKYLEDIRAAGLLLVEFTTGRSFSDYARNAMLRSAEERQFEIIGEALTQLHRRAPDTARHFGDYRRMIDFRNVLAHGYSAVDDSIVWEIVQQQLPDLLQRVRRLLLEP